MDASMTPNLLKQDLIPLILSVSLIQEKLIVVLKRVSNYTEISQSTTDRGEVLAVSE